MSRSSSRTARSSRVLGSDAATLSTATLLDGVFKPPGFNARVDEIRLKSVRDADAAWTCASSRQYGTDPRDGTPWVALHYRHFNQWADVLRVEAIHLPFKLYAWRDDGWVVSPDHDDSVWLQGNLRYRTILHTHWDTIDLAMNYNYAWDVMVGELMAKGQRVPLGRDGSDEAMRALYSRYETKGRDHRSGSYFSVYSGEKLVRQ